MAAGADVVDAGFVDQPEAGDRLRAAGCGVVFFHIPTYLTSSLVLPVVQRAATPVVFLNLQPGPSMADEDRRERAAGWRGVACSLPEMGNALHRAGIPFRSITGHLSDERAWTQIGTWLQAARAASVLRRGRFGLMGHLYPGMLDVASDLTAVPAQLGGRVEILEFDDLRERVATTSEESVDAILDQARAIFEIHSSVNDDDLRWGARVAAGLERLVDDFALDSLAYYHRGLNGELHERLGAGMILGSSLLTARGVPAAGEHELRTSLAMLVMDRIGAGGSFAELQAIDFDRGHVEMGHDGPAYLAISQRRPLLRGIGVFHGKRGWGVSVEFDVAHGPVTVFGITHFRDGRLRIVASEGAVVDGPPLEVGNTTSRVDFGHDPGEWTDAWAATAMSHHWALGTGHRLGVLRALADLVRVELVVV